MTQAERAEARDASYQAKMDADLATIAEAKANGFMDCTAIRNGLGWDEPAPNGSWRPAYQIAARFTRDAGEELVHVIPNDGSAYYIGGVRKRLALARRCGLYPEAFERTKAWRKPTTPRSQWSSGRPTSRAPWPRAWAGQRRRK